MMTLPSLCLGTWSMGGGDSWGFAEEKTSLETLAYAVDHGVEWIDTAPAYGNGQSEELLGTFLKGRDRSSLLLTSKCGLVWDEEGSMVHKKRDGVTVYRNLTPKSIRRQLEATLSRLKTDYLDLYLTHHQNPNDSLEETVGCLEELKKEGKIREYGACNVSIEQLEDYLKIGNPRVIQNRFSALEQKDLATAEFARSKGVYYQAYSPLERGVLTGKLNPEVIPEGSAKKGDRWYNPKAISLVNSKLEGLKDLEEKYGLTTSSMILDWTISTLIGGGICVGPRKINHLEGILQNLNTKILEKDKTRITETFHSIMMEAEGIWQ